MKIRHLEQSVQGLRPQTETERVTRNLVAADISKIRWYLWHNNASKLDKTLRKILAMCRIVVPETPGFDKSLKSIDFGIRDVIAYVLRNTDKPVAYGRRYYKGQSISSAMAESAVNQLINARMCKRQQMRWTPRGAHLPAQVRCAVLYGGAAEKLSAFPSIASRYFVTGWSSNSSNACRRRHENPTVFHTPAGEYETLYQSGAVAL